MIQKWQMTEGMEWINVTNFTFLVAVFHMLLCSSVGDPEETDVLRPYDGPHHGPKHHSHRHIRALQPQQFNNATNEIYPADTSNLLNVPVVKAQHFVKEVGYGRYAYGHKFTVSHPWQTLSVLEPHDVGGCLNKTLSTVKNTAEIGGCVLATNAGFFDTKRGSCHGDIVSNGRLVQHTGYQNAHFGIRRDGSLFFGYIPEDLNVGEEFQQLVSGVIWLVRDGQKFIDSSLTMESSDTQETGSLGYFTSVHSGRLAIGHDREGRVVIVQVDGRTGQRGVSLYELADILIKWGIVNAINLDGGGSVTAVLNNTLVNYPSDTCDGGFSCARPVSTVICAHEPLCNPQDCNSHGDCVKGFCHCHGNWVGHGCDHLECEPTNCTSHGECTENGCVCQPGWLGASCEEGCPPGLFGLNCSAICRCRNGAKCNPEDGSCACPPGYTGELCDRDCPYGFYGSNCQQLCFCENSCGCHSATGRCNVTAHSSTIVQVAQCLANQLWQSYQPPVDYDSQYRLWFISTVFITCLAISSLFLNIVLLSKTRGSNEEPISEKFSRQHTYRAAYLISTSSEDKESLSDLEPPKRQKKKHKKSSTRLKNARKNKETNDISFNHSSENNERTKLFQPSTSQTIDVDDSMS